MKQIEYKGKHLFFLIFVPCNVMDYFHVKFLFLTILNKLLDDLFIILRYQVM